MMTLEEAIKHCKDVALSCTNKECALEHFQLLKWLQEYSNMLEKQGEQKQILDVEIPFGAKDSELQEATYYIPKGFHAKIEGDKVVIKKGEQKPADNKGMNIDEEFINALGTMLNDGLPDRYLVSEERIKKSAELLFSIARKQLKNEMQEWSEEDKNMLQSILDEYKSMPTVKRNWLKSLKERYTWKPNDEQMKALKEAVDEHFDIDGGALWYLYEDLKKLREE